LSQLEKQLKECQQNLKKIWNDDQLHALTIPCESKVPQWSSQTIKESLQMRLLIGANG